MAQILLFPHFSVGQIVYHHYLRYRAVVVGIDLKIDETIDGHPKIPWYSLLIDNSVGIAKVIEKDLQDCNLKGTINHPLLFDYFNSFEKGRYLKIRYHLEDVYCLSISSH